MKIMSYLAGASLALGFYCLSTGSAEAQASHAAVSNLGLVGSSGLVSAHSSQKDDVEEEANRRPMGWAGIGLKVGAAGMSAGRLTVAGQEGRTSSRMGIQVSMPINLGGDGFGWMLEPYFMQSATNHDTVDAQGAVLGSENVALSALGVYTGPTFNIHAMDELYVGFGFGIKAAYLMNDSIDYAADAYARVPVHATYYLSRRMALVGEVGFGYGASAFADKPEARLNADSRRVEAVSADPRFGLAYTWDATVGIRLP